MLDTRRKIQTTPADRPIINMQKPGKIEQITAKFVDRAWEILIAAINKALLPPKAYFEADNYKPDRI